MTREQQIHRLADQLWADRPDETEASWRDRVEAAMLCWRTPLPPVTPELLACPFCGGTAYLRGYGDRPYVRAECYCTASVAGKNNAEATWRWNRRWGQ